MKHTHIYTHTQCEVASAGSVRFNSSCCVQRQQLPMPNDERYSRTTRTGRRFILNPPIRGPITHTYTHTNTHTDTHTHTHTEAHTHTGTHTGTHTHTHTKQRRTGRRCVGTSWASRASHPFPGSTPRTSPPPWACTPRAGTVMCVCVCLFKCVCVGCVLAAWRCCSQHSRRRRLLHQSPTPRKITHT